MGALVFLSILAATVLFLLGWSLIAYWQRCQREKKRRQTLLEEFGPWLKDLKRMDDEQFEKEFKRVRNLWMETKENAERLQFQLDLVCQEDGRRRGLKHQKRHYRFSKHIDEWL